VSELGTQRAIAFARSGIVSGPAPTTAPTGAEAATDDTRAWAMLAAVLDPELPIVSIIDLGMVGGLRVDPDVVEVTLLPTFIGCPALELIEAAVRAALVPLGRPVAVATSFDPPWTTERITPEGRAALAAAGIAPPAEPADVHCPMCASSQVVLDSLFGPTRCRSLFYCRDCRQPFEAMKPV
jgi:ring-1,2-phenylacetyl-CoA epoxidase subunit PaaD